MNNIFEKHWTLCVLAFIASFLTANILGSFVGAFMAGKDASIPKPKQPHITITVPVKAQKILEGLAERGVDEVGITIDPDEKL